MDGITVKYMPVGDFELKADGEEQGRLRAKFTTFDIEDSYGDIVRREALTDYDGAEVLLCWGHDWTKPIGKGVIKVLDDHAIWDGHFWLDTIDGLEAFKKVKNAGAKQEYSWGFKVKEAKPILDKEEDGDFFYWFGPIEILKAEPIEVSPVLIGANPQTGTLSLKDRKILRKSLGMPEISTSEDADVTTTEPEQGMTLSDEGDAALAAVSAYLTRVEALAAERAEEGRTPSKSHAERLEAIRSKIDELAAIYARNEVPSIEMRDLELRAEILRRKLAVL